MCALFSWTKLFAAFSYWSKGSSIIYVNKRGCGGGGGLNSRTIADKREEGSRQADVNSENNVIIRMLFFLQLANNQLTIESLVSDDRRSTDRYL